MKLYLLTRNDEVYYDEFRAKVIVAENPGHARYIANVRTGDEGKIWMDTQKVMCEEISLTKSSIVWEDFRAG